MGRRYGAEVNSTGCSYRKPGFGSQYPPGISKTSVTPIQGDPMPSCGLWRHTYDIHAYTLAKHPYICKTDFKSNIAKHKVENNLSNAFSINLQPSHVCAHIHVNTRTSPHWYPHTYMSTHTPKSIHAHIAHTSPHLYLYTPIHTKNKLLLNKRAFRSWVHRHSSALNKRDQTQMCDSERTVWILDYTPFNYNSITTVYYIHVIGHIFRMVQQKERGGWKC